jgi:hypothetical protein
MPVLNHAGFEGKATINGTDPNIDKWSMTESVQDNDVTTTGDYVSGENRAYTRHFAGKCSLEGTIEFPYDSNNDPWPGSIRAGTILTNVILTKTTGHVITMPQAFTKSVALDQGGMDGVFKYTLSISNQGPYTIT